MLEFLALLLPLANSSLWPLPVTPSLPKASFRPSERAVGNWRVQAALDLDLSAEAALRWLAGNTPANLPRCIRLNNYWCIKKAGWAGEIGADPEDHVAFASAAEGAVAAATLLRRYYVDYGRKSARAIVAHWAPAQCEPSVVAAGTPAQTGFSLIPLTKYGIGNTLRARWLAAHGRGGTRNTRRGTRKIAVRGSAVPDRLALPTRAATSPRGGPAPEPPLVLEPPIKTERLHIAAISPPAPSHDASLVSAAPPVASCSGDSLRLANYAARAIEGIARSPEEDLKLFDANGAPLPPLRRLLANMAAVEIGPYSVDGKLIDVAIETMRLVPPRALTLGNNSIRPGDR